MSYRIEKNEALSAALGRIAAEEIALALSELQRTRHAEAMHNTRKSLKRLRSLLRSLRVVFPKNLLRREDRRLAKAGRKIAPLRDVHVQLRTFEKLQAAPDAATRNIEQNLRRRELVCARKIPVLRRALRQMLAESRKTIAALPMDQATPTKLAAGCKRICKRGRASFKATRQKTTPESLNEWRKQTKILWHTFELIEGLSPKTASAMTNDAAQLCQDLGDDHDLFMVLQVLRREDAARPARDYRRLSKRIAAKRSRLQKQAFKLGKKIYTGKPGPFQRRLELWLARNSSKK